MDKQEFVVKIAEEDSKLLQRKQYEFNAKASIVGFLAQDKAIDWESIQEEINSAEVSSVELDFAKALISTKALKDNNINIDLQYFNWSLDYYDHEITFTQGVTIPKVIGMGIFDMDEEDVEELEELQYEYNASASIMSILKESKETNKEIISEYGKVLLARKIELESLKSDIAHKYNEEKLDLTKHNWNVDFIEKTITFYEVEL